MIKLIYSISWLRSLQLLVLVMIVGLADCNSFAEQTDKEHSLAIDSITASRVHAHTRLRQQWRGHPDYSLASSRLSDLGARIATRHFKSVNESPTWPTEYDKSAADLSRQLVKEGKQSNIAYIAYYWMMSDEQVRIQNPEWVCKNRLSEPIKEFKGYDLDITSEYRKVVLGRLLDLAERGVVGYYFDYTHLPKNGCYGTELEARFRLTRKYKIALIDEKEYISFQARQVEDVFRYWEKEVKQRYPNVTFVISTGPLAALTDPIITTRLAEISDLPKTEFSLAIRPTQSRYVFEKNPDLPRPRDDIRIGLGWSILRDSADGRSPHVWFAGVKNTDEGEAFVWAVMAYGGIANLDIHESVILNTIKSTQKVDFRRLFNIGDTVGANLRGARMVKFGGVYFSEYARDRAGSDKLAWQQALWPLNLGFQCFVDGGLPVMTLNDRQIDAGHLRGVKVLVTPERKYLPPYVVENLINYATEGGRWIEVTSVNFESDQQRVQTALNRTCGEIKAARVKSGIYVEMSSNKNVHGGFFEDHNGDSIVILSNDFTSILPFKKKVVIPRIENQTIDYVRLITHGVRVKRAINILNNAELGYKYVDGASIIEVPAYKIGIAIKLVK